MFQAINITKLNKQHDIHTRKELFIFLRNALLTYQKQREIGIMYFQKGFYTIIAGIIGFIFTFIIYFIKCFLI